MGEQRGGMDPIYFFVQAQAQAQAQAGQVGRQVRERKKKKTPAVNDGSKKKTPARFLFSVVDRLFFFYFAEDLGDNTGVGWTGADQAVFSSSFCSHVVLSPPPPPLSLLSLTHLPHG